MKALYLGLALALVGCAPIDVIAGEDADTSDAGAPIDGARLDAGGPVLPPGQVGGGFCDQQDDCDACRACSQAPFEQCNRLALDCEAQPECPALAECLERCATDDSDCVRACVVDHPSGREPLIDLVLCHVCDACLRDCAVHSASCEGALPF